MKTTTPSASNIEKELKWLEARIKDIKKDIDSTPYTDIKDRVISVMTANGPTEKVTATEEVQKKAIREALKEYTLLLGEVDKLREREKSKVVEARGGGSLNNQMKRLTGNA